MSEHPREPHGAGTDQELDLRSIVWFGIGLFGVLVVVFALMGLLSGAFKTSLAGQDPPAPAMTEAREPHSRPELRLQHEPNKEMDALRAEDERVLGSYGIVDKKNGIARIPIDRAIEIVVVAERGLGSKREAK